MLFSACEDSFDGFELWDADRMVLQELAADIPANNEGVPISSRLSQQTLDIYAGSEPARARKFIGAPPQSEPPRLAISHIIAIANQHSGGCFRFEG
jgi:hypothetical protein